MRVPFVEPRRSVRPDARYAAEGVNKLLVGNKCDLQAKKVPFRGGAEGKPEINSWRHTLSIHFFNGAIVFFVPRVPL